MNSDWVSTTLGEHVEIIHGWAFQGQNFRAPSAGLPIVVKPGNFRQSGGLDFGYGRTQAYQGEYPAEYELDPGDLLVVMTCQTPGGEILGVPGVVPDGDTRYLHNQRLGKVQIRDGAPINRDFLYWLLNDWGIRRQLVGSASGSTVLHTSPSRMKEVAIRLPRLGEQRRIAWLLGSLDDTIENNRRIAKTLEEIAATLFKARFVDFFDRDDVVESEIGPIPRGWSVMPVESLADYVNGKAFTKYGNGRGRMVIRIAELKSGPGRATVYSDYETTREFMASPGDILFAWSGSLDVYRWHRGDALINQHIFKVIPRGYPAWFVFHALKQVVPQFQAIAADKATTMGHIKRSHLAEFSVAVPPTDVLERDDREFGPVFDRALRARLEAETLVQIRDRLLPRLISGEMRVPPEEGVPMEAA